MLKTVGHFLYVLRGFDNSVDFPQICGKSDKYCDFLFPAHQAPSKKGFLNRWFERVSLAYINLDVNQKYDDDDDVVVRNLFVLRF